jgi:nicotinate-nucleotide adenylyltransferase
LTPPDPVAARDASMERKIGLLGGTFDPIHNAHLFMGELAADELGLSEIIFMPAGRPPHKSGETITASAHRLAMVKLAIEDSPRFKVSDLEISRNSPSYTIDTVRTLLGELGRNSSLYLVIGSDSLLELCTWKDYDELMSLVRLAVYPRPGFSAPAGDFSRAGRVETLSAGGLGFDLSSSEIRARVRAGLSIRYLVPRAVERYIAEAGLYRGA